MCVCVGGLCLAFAVGGGGVSLFSILRWGEGVPCFPFCGMGGGGGGRGRSTPVGKRPVIIIG